MPVCLDFEVQNINERFSSAGGGRTFPHRSSSGEHLVVVGGREHIVPAVPTIPSNRYRTDLAKLTYGTVGSF